MPKCKNCQHDFDVTSKDLDFYKRIATPIPTFCPNCRRQRRLSFRNERNLYIRNCDFSCKPMVTVYSPDKPIKVFHHDIWWSDKWDAKDYGRDFDFTRPFFEQFAELQSAVPRMSMIISHCENSDYAPYSVNSRNCYMCVSSNYSEDVLYSYQTNSSKDCVDCSLSYHCELCYECLYCVRLYHSFWSVNCNNCSDLYFCRDCQGCSNCIGCCGLKNKSFHIFNKPVNEKEFNDFVANLDKRSALKKLALQFEEFSRQFPFRSGYTIGSENVSGDHLINSKNCEYCFEAEGLEDCKFIYTIPKNAQDCYDCHYSQNAELCYDSISSVNDYNCKFVLHAWDVKNSAYVQECYYSSDLFGCIGLKQSKYCILNKQYSEDEYKDLVPRIIEHMKKTASPLGERAGERGPGFASPSDAELINQEFGEYFPINLSLFAYNESLAQEFFPLTKDAVLANGWRWKEKDLMEYRPADFKLPGGASELDKDVIGKVLACNECGKNYKIIEQEFKFYKQNKLPAPEKCPNCRHARRIKLRNLSHLWDVNCGRCHNSLKSSYDPVRYPQIYCEKCFLDALN